METIKTWVRKHYRKDGIFSWMVCLSVFICNTINEGIDASFGEFVGSAMHAFNGSEYDVAWIGSVHSSAQFFSAALSSALANKFSFVAVISTGTVILCLSYTVSIFSNGLTGLTIAYGVLAGIGTGMLLGPSSIICTFYFDEKLAIATGLSYSGIGFGIILIPFATNLINSTYGWQGCMILFAAISPLNILLGLMSMIVPYGEGSSADSDDNNEEQQNERENNVSTEPQVSNIAQILVGLKCAEILIRVLYQSPCTFILNIAGYNI